MSNINFVDTTGFCHLKPEFICGLEVVNVAAESVSSSDNVALSGCAADYVTDGDGVIAFADFLPGSGHLAAAESFIVKERSASGICNHPKTVGILCPVGNGIPVRGLIGLNKTVFNSLLGECNTNVADCSGGVACEHIKFLSGAHIRVIMSDAVLSSVLFPGLSPVCPAVRHTDGFKVTFFFCFLNDFIKGVIVEVYCVLVSGRRASGKQETEASNNCNQFEQCGFTHVVPSL